MAGAAFNDIDALNAWLSDKNMGGSWNVQRSGASECRPYLWKWSDI